MRKTARLADDPTVVERILDHFDNQTTDPSEATLPLSAGARARPGGG